MNAFVGVPLSCGFHIHKGRECIPCRQRMPSTRQKTLGLEALKTKHGVGHPQHLHFPNCSFNPFKLYLRAPIIYLEKANSPAQLVVWSGNRVKSPHKRSDKSVLDSIWLAVTGLGSRVAAQLQSAGWSPRLHSSDPALAQRLALARLQRLVPGGPQGHSVLHTVGLTLLESLLRVEPPALAAEQSGWTQLYVPPKSAGAHRLQVSTWGPSLE